MDLHLQQVWENFTHQHMNDGYSQMDSGMIFGSVNIAHAAEFIYYLKRYNHPGSCIL